MTFSKKFCAKSPFKGTSIGVGIHQDDPMERTRRYARESTARMMAERRSEVKHRGKYADQEKEMLLAAAERKEKNAAKKEAKGNTKAAARKRRKAAKLRERAEGATGADIERSKVNQDMFSYDNMQRLKNRRTRPNVNPAAFAKKSSFKKFGVFARYYKAR